MASISPGVYTKVYDKPIAPIPVLGTTAFFWILSEKGPDNVVVNLSSTNPIEVFGSPNYDKYGQSLYNLIRYHNISTAVYAMRVLPTVAEANTLSAQLNQTVLPPSFSHAIIGYVKATKTVTDKNTGDSTTDTKYGLMVYYLDKLESAVNVKDGIVTRLGDTYTSFVPGTLDYLYNSSLGTTDVTFPADTAIQDVDPNLANSAIAATLWPNKDVEGTYYYDLAQYVSKNGTTEESDTTTTSYSAEFVPLFMIYAVGRGDWYNQFQIALTPASDDPNLVQGLPPKAYHLSINLVNPELGISTEVESYRISFDPNYKDVNNTTLYIGEVVNRNSEYIRIYAYATNLANAQSTPIDDTSQMTILDWVLTSFYNNEQGLPIDSPSKITFETTIYTNRVGITINYGRFYDLFNADGTLNTRFFELALINAINGMYDYTILNPDAYHISLIFDAGFSVQVKQQFEGFISKRLGETFGVLDLPYASSVDEALNLRATQLNISNPNLAIYSQYVAVYDTYTDKIVWFAPSYHLARIYPLNDAQAGFWYSPAWLNRGALDEVRGLSFEVKSRDDFDRLFLNQINPIIKKQGVYVIGSARTSYRFRSSRQYISVARTIVELRRQLRLALERIIYENITKETLALIEQTARNILNEYRNNGAIVGYTIKVVANEQDKRNGRVQVYISIIPVYPLERIELYFEV